jgi:DNA-cytosine methyltransferase
MMAWNMLQLAAPQACPAVEVWTSEIGDAPRRWLARLLPSAVHFNNVKRSYKKTASGFTMTGTTVGGGTASIKTGAVDVYVAGFPCNPWSSRGSRSGFDHDDASLFFECAKAIQAIRPKAFILENVPSVFGSDSVQKLRDTMDTLRSYKWKAVLVNTLSFGVPQNRRRVYIIGLNEDSVSGDRNDALCGVVADMRKLKTSWIPWPDYLTLLNMPMQRTSETSETSAAAPCDTCGLNAACPIHICKCNSCLKGSSTKKCKWHATTRRFVRKKRGTIKKFLKLLRKVKKKVLKTAPSYWYVARARNLQVDSRIANNARIRNLLDAHAKCCNIMSSNILLDVSQSVERTGLREDGTAPTLTTTCGSLYSPCRGMCMTPRQCFALQGIPLDQVDWADDFSDRDLFTMAGMALSAQP